MTDDGFSDSPTVARPAVHRTERDAAFRLSVVEGRSLGQSFAVDPSLPVRVLIGKSPACEARIDDPEVSRRHAAVEVRGRRLRLVDLGSTNGTTVNGIAVVEALLEGGELIRMGQTALSVERVGGARVPDPGGEHFARLSGRSSAMRRLYPLCRRLADSNVPVVIEGETGTGKEQLAEALHEAGPRSKAPFVVFDCTAVAPSLIESELFGHQRGAFTGSVASHRGVFERADTGTLLIDEIGDLPLEMQPKLLRLVERGEIHRVGAERPIKVDVRLLFATRRNLDQEVQAGRFRDDLFHRIAVTRIELPPLRERAGDVELLAGIFAHELGAGPELLTREILASWSDYAWPGNVRELRNAVLRLIAVGDVTAELEPPRAEEPAGQRSAPAATLHDVIGRILAEDLPLVDARAKLNHEFEHRYLEHVLAAHGGNVTRAAAAAGIARRHFYRLRARRNDDG